MTSYHEFSAKLVSLENMRRVTAAMKMLSTARFRRAREARRCARRYLQGLASLFNRVARLPECADHPLFQYGPKDRPAWVVLISSDMGLCAGFNHNLVRRLQQWVAEQPAEPAVELICLGRRGYLAVRRSMTIRVAHPFAGAANVKRAGAIAGDVLAAFRAREISSVFLAWNVFHNALSQTPTVAPLLPLARPEEAIPAREDEELLLEPAVPALMDHVGERAVTGRVLGALLDHAAGEHGARMTAMDQASRNIDRLYEEYTLLRNRARQTTITQEIIEVVSGAETLR